MENRTETMLKQLDSQERYELRKIEFRISQYECDLIPEMETQINLLDARYKKPMNLREFDSYLANKLYYVETLGTWAVELQSLYSRQDLLISKARLRLEAKEQGEDVELPELERHSDGAEDQNVDGEKENLGRALKDRAQDAERQVGDHRDAEVAREEKDQLGGLVGEQ